MHDIFRGAIPDGPLYDTNLDVKFLACAMAMNALVGKEEKPVQEYSGTAGASAFVQGAVDPEWTTLTY